MCTASAPRPATSPTVATLGAVTPTPPSPATPRGRRPRGADTRGAIVDAARAAFAADGYDATSLRGIARAAGVDAALVHHYFDGKAALFAEVMDLRVDPTVVVARVLEGEPQTVGERMVRGFLGVWDDPENTTRLVGVLRAAMSHDHAARQLREFLAAEVFGRVAAAYCPQGDPTLPLRAAVAAAQMVGVALMRYAVAHPVVASASPDELAALLGPTLQSYLVAPSAQGG